MLGVRLRKSLGSSGKEPMNGRSPCRPVRHLARSGAGGLRSSVPPGARLASDAMIAARTKALGLACAVAVLGTASTAGASKVKGKVAGWKALLNPVWKRRATPRSTATPSASPCPRFARSSASCFPHIPKELCIVALAEQKQSPQKTAILIRVGGGRTTPVTIVVPPGQQLQFHNTDPFKHKLYAWRAELRRGGDHQRRASRLERARRRLVRGSRLCGPSLRMWVIGEPNVAAIAYRTSRRVRAHHSHRGHVHRAGPTSPARRSAPPSRWKPRPNDVELKDVIKVAVEKKAEKKDDKAKADDKGKTTTRAKASNAPVSLLVRGARSAARRGSLRAVLAAGMYNRVGAHARARRSRRTAKWFRRSSATTRAQRSAQLIQFALNADIAKYLGKSSDSDAKVPTRRATRSAPRCATSTPRSPPSSPSMRCSPWNTHGRVVAHTGYEQASGMEDFELGGYRRG